eukprot:GHVT01063832.1.p1 GENE.GHVT01063832.1~~GHVT01063832.1.p1  ORF type:complete len:239 (+),score=35.02 GHVT01063832.1:410-1126(+)
MWGRALYTCVAFFCFHQLGQTLLSATAAPRPAGRVLATLRSVSNYGVSSGGGGPSFPNGAAATSTPIIAVESERKAVEEVSSASRMRRLGILGSVRLLPLPAPLVAKMQESHPSSSYLSDAHGAIVVQPGSATDDVANDVDHAASSASPVPAKKLNAAMLPNGMDLLPLSFFEAWGKETEQMVRMNRAFFSTVKGINQDLASQSGGMSSTDEDGRLQSLKEEFEKGGIDVPNYEYSDS